MNNAATTTHTGAFLIRDENGTPAMLTSTYEQAPEGIWTWTGLWVNATAETLTAGYIIRDWAFWLDSNSPATRGDWVIVKVNRVTITVQQVTDGIAHGPVHPVRLAA